MIDAQKRKALTSVGDKIKNSTKQEFQRKKLPPYGKTTRPENNLVRVLYGWPQDSYEVQQSIVLPVGEDPAQYSWPVKNLDVFCSANVYTGPIIPTDVALSLSESLTRDGAKSLVIFGTKRKPNGGVDGLHFWPGGLIKAGVEHEA